MALHNNVGTMVLHKQGASAHPSASTMTAGIRERRHLRAGPCVAPNELLARLSEADLTVHPLHNAAANGDVNACRALLVAGEAAGLI